MSSIFLTYDLKLSGYRDMFFTPLTVASFLIIWVSCFWSSIMTVRVPENRPSSDDWIEMLRSTTFFSLLMMEVMLFTMPMSSFPIT